LFVQGHLPVRVGRLEPAEDGQHRRFHHRKAFGGPVFQVLAGFFAGEAGEDFPGRVAQVEKGLSPPVYEVAAVGGHAQGLGRTAQPGQKQHEQGAKSHGTQDHKGNLTARAQRKTQRSVYFFAVDSSEQTCF
jgi:hypothetical protein